MAAQLDYGYSTPKGVAGGKFDIAYDEVVTRKNEEEDGVLKYGMAAMIGTAKGTSVKIPTTGATKAKIEGIVLRAANTEQDMKGKVVVRKNASVGILRKGHVWGRISQECNPEYKNTAYVVVDGNDAGCFTDQSAAYSVYVKAESGDSGAKEVVADTATPTAAQIKVSDVAPASAGYVPAVGDYVASKQLHGATVDIGATFGNASDNGIAVIEINM